MDLSCSNSSDRRSFLTQLGATGLALAAGSKALASATRPAAGKVDVSRWLVSAPRPSEFTEASGVYQDSILAIARDTRNQLWAVLGQWYGGGLTVWKGTRVDQMTRRYYAKYNFKLGAAGESYDGIPYPDGAWSRGQIWAMGLWIDPHNNEFYCFVHNETGWDAYGTGYSALGPSNGEPDFRHIGLITSTNEGRTWDFKGWIITSHYPCWTTRYRPEHLKGGQGSEIVYLGAGDFSLFVNHHDGYMYIFYTQVRHNMVTRKGAGSSIYIARSPITAKGLPGTWKKYFDGSFSQPGNMGQESPVVEDVFQGFVAYDDYLKSYMMTAGGRGGCHVSFSPNLLHWTKPQLLAPGRADLPKGYYFTALNTNEAGPPNVLGRVFTLFIASHGPAVLEASVTIEP
jgi:hypothetical protein